jgi:hypothetical protein
VDRTRLAELLDKDGAAFARCREAVLSGAPFSVSESSQPAAQFEEIYAGREAHTRSIGLPTVGFADALRGLRAHGDRPVHVGGVDVADPPYHFVFFLDEELTTAVGCIGVDQHKGYRFHPGDEALLACRLVGWLSDRLPERVRAELSDAAGTAWVLVGEPSAFGVLPGTVTPVPAAVRCEVVAVVAREEPETPPWLEVSTATAGVAADDGAHRFTVAGEQLQPVPLG